MKRKILLLALTAIMLTSCGQTNESSLKNDDSSIGEISESSSTQSDHSSESSSEVSSESFDSSDDLEELMQYKSAAIDKLDEIINPIIAKISDVDLKNAVQEFYDDEKEYIVAITDLSIAKAAVEKVITDAKSFAVNTLKPLGVKKLNDLFLPLIDKLPDEDLQVSVKNFYQTEIDKISAVESLDDIVSLYEEILNDVQKFIEEETERILILLKDKAVEELDKYIEALILKIPYEKLKEDLLSFYEEEIVKVENADTIQDLKLLVDILKEDLLDFAVTEMVSIAITELDQYVVALLNKICNTELKADIQDLYEEEIKKLESCKTCEEVIGTLQDIKDDLIEFAITESKKIAKAELDALVEAGLNRIPNAKFKKELSDFYDEEILKLMAVEDLDDIKPTLATILEETAAFIKELVVNSFKDYLKQLFTYNLADPYQYIPETMRPSYANNFVTSPVSDFTSDVAISSMNREGFGEQWQMVVDNLNQMLKVTKAMNVVDATMTTVSQAMNIYIENATTDELEYSLTNDTVSAQLSFNGSIFYLEVLLNTNISLPGFGSVKPVVKMALDIETLEKTIYIAVNENNIVKYTMSDSEFELACTYGVTVANKTGNRTSYFSTSTDKSGNKEGHIYEYTSFEGTDLIQACADFYVKDGYVSVVGNKASGMLAFTGYINELYSESTGYLLGYKVQEELTILGVTGTYHTLWFNLWNISGINSVKVLEKSKDNKSDKSTVDVYLNGGNSLLVPTYNKKVVKTSRKYDIELRDKYYFNKVSNELVKSNAQVPMMFIQDDNDVDTNYSDFSSDFLKDNGINVSVNVSSNVLTKIRDDYDTLIPVFKQNKDTMSSETIKLYLSLFYEL